MLSLLCRPAAYETDPMYHVSAGEPIVTMLDYDLNRLYQEERRVAAASYRLVTESRQASAKFSSYLVGASGLQACIRRKPGLVRIGERPQHV